MKFDFILIKIIIIKDKYISKLKQIILQMFDSFLYFRQITKHKFIAFIFINYFKIKLPNKF